MGTELSSRMEERHHPRIGCVAVCAPAACWRIHHGVGQSGDGDLMSHSPGRGVFVGTANGRWFANGAQALLRCNAANATCTRHRAGLRGHEYQFSVRSLLFFLFIFWDLK